MCFTLVFTLPNLATNNLYITQQYNLLPYLIQALNRINQITVLYSTVLYSTVQYCTVLYSIVQYCVVNSTVPYRINQCSAPSPAHHCPRLPTAQSIPIVTWHPYLELYSTILYCIVLYYTVLYCIVLYYTVLYCTVLYYTVLYCIVLYYAVIYSVIL